MSKEREESEPPYFTNPPKVTKKKVAEGPHGHSFSLGLDGGLEGEQTEPEILVNPPEYDEDEIDG